MPLIKLFRKPEETRHHPPKFARSDFLPPIEVVEEKTTFTIMMELPGVKPEDFEVLLSNDNKLYVLGEKKRQQQGQQDGYVERNYGYFCRKIQIPNVDESKAKASLDDGVLTIQLAKILE